MIKSIGELFYKKRTESEISLEQAKFETGISILNIHNLEENKFDKIGETFYIKAYLKIYADYLGLSPKSILALYKRDYENLGFRSKRLEDLYKKQEKRENLFIKALQIVSKKRLFLLTFFIFFILFSLLTFSVIKGAFDKPNFNLSFPVTLENGYEGEISFAQDKIRFEGNAEKDSRLFLNDKKIEITDGKFITEDFTLDQTITDFKFKAINSLNISSNINLTVKKTTEILSRIDFKVKVLEEVEVNVKLDGELKYLDQMYPNLIYQFSANESFNIDSLNQSKILVVVNDEIYTLEKRLENFRLDKEKNKIIRD